MRPLAAPFKAEPPGFNPRTRKGCDAKNLISSFGNRVSIHAPVKDATNECKDLAARLRVSIHAPVKDATRRITLCNISYLVSIHAPVKDATPLGQMIR